MYRLKLGMAVCMICVILGSHNVISLVKSKRVWYIHLGTPCEFWSVATTQSREARRMLGLRSARCSIRLIELALKLNRFLDLGKSCT
jgi:hypothetical protein